MCFALINNCANYVLHKNFNFINGVNPLLIYPDMLIEYRKS